MCYSYKELHYKEFPRTSSLILPSISNIKNQQVTCKLSIQIKFPLAELSSQWRQFMGTDYLPIPPWTGDNFAWPLPSLLCWVDDPSWITFSTQGANGWGVELLVCRRVWNKILLYFQNFQFIYKSTWMNPGSPKVSLQPDKNYLKNIIIIIIMNN